MVKISYAPIQELVVHEVVESPMDDLLRERIMPAGVMPLYWCDGILFSFTSVPMSRKTIDDYLEGKIHWMEVHFCKMKDYKPVLELTDEHYRSSEPMKIRVIDTSKSSLHAEFVKWLKKASTKQ